MSKKSMLIVLCFSVGMLGCSSKPDASDLQLEELWGECSGLKLVDLKKTNGIDHGNTYDISVSYRLEITKNATASEAWGQEVICPAPTMLEVFRSVGALNKKLYLPLKIGDSLEVNATFPMIKSENGWVRE